MSRPDSRWPRWSFPRGDDAGSATVLALGVLLAVLTVTIGGLALLSALRAAHVARSSADLAALAAAGHVQQHADSAAACAQARRIARRHEARVVACRIDSGGVARVSTSVPIADVPLLGPSKAQGYARAGPG